MKNSLKYVVATSLLVVSLYGSAEAQKLSRKETQELIARYSQDIRILRDSITGMQQALAEAEADSTTHTRLNTIRLQIKLRSTIKAIYQEDGNRARYLLDSAAVERVIASTSQETESFLAFSQHIKGCIRSCRQEIESAEIEITRLESGKRRGKKKLDYKYKL